ncbi:hypothetical protein CW362_41425 [Streptomyces populi]|uniref:Uncharacterized protein n=2 Tax=Streptomyces populi TaxID=2058924 RepID=A0A2I0SBD7_9ACTN|nr:hypothetical protein CW362_41425 [Streptomyces populi]
MRHESTSGRRGALVSASAAVLCLGGLLAACGGGGGGGYAAVGAADGSPRAPGAVVAPSGEVSLVPLDGRPARGSGSPGGEAGSGSGSRSPATGPAGAPADGAGDTGGPDTDEGDPGPGTKDAGGTGTGTGGGSPSPPGSPSDGEPGRTGGSSGSSSAPPAPGPTVSAGPAVLAVSGTSRAATDRRWCEKVTVSFSNTGGTAVRSGTVTFGTHIIGALGIDWATIRSTEALPAPIAAGAKKSGTWTVCVDSWRVPLGMHVETRDVSVDWK